MKILYWERFDFFLPGHFRIFPTTAKDFSETFAVCSAAEWEITASAIAEMHRKRRSPLARWEAIGLLTDTIQVNAGG